MNKAQSALMAMVDSNMRSFSREFLVEQWNIHYDRSMRGNRTSVLLRDAYAREIDRRDLESATAK